jgi:hypothetical protein
LDPLGGKLGMVLLATRQFHPGRGVDGFHVLRTPGDCKRDERQMPILGSMTDLDFDVWDEGGRLLQKVAPAAP